MTTGIEDTLEGNEVLSRVTGDHSESPRRLLARTRKA